MGGARSILPDDDPSVGGDGVGARQVRNPALRAFLFVNLFWVRCDLRLCVMGAKLGMPPAKLGLIYGHTGLAKFIDVIGIARTKELFLTGRNLSAPRAMAVGLVHDTVPEGELPETALRLATEIAANAPLSMRGNKRAIETLNSYDRLTPDQERELVELRRSCFESEDLREGIKAFAEKRAPRWTGR